jgi:hypothetical protein
MLKQVAPLAKPKARAYFGIDAKVYGHMGHVDPSALKVLLPTCVRRRQWASGRETGKSTGKGLPAAMWAARWLCGGSLLAAAMFPGRGLCLHCAARPAWPAPPVNTGALGQPHLRVLGGSQQL